MNDLLNRESLRRIAPRPGDRVLDVGSGLGLLAGEMAAAVGSGGCVVGIERDPAQIAEGERLAHVRGARHRVDVRPGDAYHFPLRADEWGSFDIAHARFLLEHLARPQEVVDAMVRAVRPGGRVILEDDDHEALIVFPPVPEFERLWCAYARAYEAQGRDPRIGRRLVVLLSRAGAAPTRCDWPFFGACAGSETYPLIVGNCRRILTGARDTIIASGGVTADEFDAGISAYDAWCGQPDASYWYCTFWAEGTRRA